MIDLLFASNNRGKYDELTKDFSAVGINLIFDGNLLLEENSETLKSNAISKAYSAAKQRGMIALGDDSGIFVEALDYFPGVHSRRWFNGTDHERNAELLNIMKDEKNRLVYLISRFAVVNPSGDVLFSDYIKNEFELSNKEIGSNGFGYDSILIPHYYKKAWDEEADSEYYWKEFKEKTMKTIYWQGHDFFKERAELESYCEKQKKTIAQLSQDEKNLINNRGRIAMAVRLFLEENSEEKLVFTGNKKEIKYEERKKDYDRNRKIS